MTTETITREPGAGPDWGRAEFILTGIAFLSFLLIPLHINTIYSGLPAHPLFLHVPVMLIPIAAVGGIAFVIRPEWFNRWGIALCGLAIVGMASLFLTMGAGSALRHALHLGGGGFGEAALVQRHSSAADKLRILTILFTAGLILTFAAARISGGRPTGLGIADRILSQNWVGVTLKGLLVLLALGCLYMTWKTGDLGAKAVWNGRLNHGFPGGRGGGFGGFGGGGFPGGP